MKKLVLALMFPVAAWAASARPDGADVPKSNVVDISYAQRVIHLHSERNSISADGVILVCMPPNQTSWKDGTCLNASGNNAWLAASNLQIAGHQLTGFEYRFVGSGGYRNLILYFKKKQ